MYSNKPNKPATITNSMKDGVVQYGDTFMDGSVYRQKAIERKLIEALRHYSGTDNRELLRGLMLANEIVKGNHIIEKKIEKTA